MTVVALMSGKHVMCEKPMAMNYAESLKMIDAKNKSGKLLIKHLGEAIYFVHAKDTYIDKTNVSVNGVIDAKSYADEFNRSWIFRTVGYGHGGETWKEIVSALKLAGYDYVLSIEHEDSLMTPLEGLGKAIEFLKKVIITEETSNSGKWWI
jgi:sugar phosphate isomerase/epimerase